MSLPEQMTDRWKHRPQPSPDRLYWHVLLRDNPQVRALAREGQERLTAFPGMHLVPPEWLHLTTLIAGPAQEIDSNQRARMIERTRDLLTQVPPAPVTLGRILYHPEAIALAVRPAEALLPILHAVQDATRHATGREGVLDTEPWLPHVTLAYSTADQPAAPVIAALGRHLPGCDIVIDTISLVLQEGDERLWNWKPLAHLPVGGES
ncbi:2'-5' RNA ligase family protein [Bailinhaonella thermotolerans]|uniref:2'-5' RNA ligase family protein n=1 Tax=Bailinhaonella thermotolerans TaxID=1070861 RepID=UPI00192A21A8|nr:2'-5' RNA ligase family protein [Bailinhaonella thermotolerans]